MHSDQAAGDRQATIDQRASLIAETWYQMIHAASPAARGTKKADQLADDLRRQISRCLVAEDQGQEEVDALARELVSLRLSPEVLGALQEVLVRELTDGSVAVELTALGVHPGKLIAHFTEGLVRATRAVVLDEQEAIREAYTHALRQTQRDLRVKDAALQRRVERLEVLQQIDRGILAAGSPREISAAALRHIHRVVPCARASVTLFDLEEDRAEILAAVPSQAFGPDLLEATFPLAGWEAVLDALRRDEIHIIQDLRQLPLTTAMRERFDRHAPHTLATVPLRSGDDLLGALNLVLEAEGDLTERHATIAREVADSLAVAISHAQLDASIAQHQVQLRTLTARLAEIDEAKRRDLARELHDRIGQRLTALGVNLNVLKAEVDIEQAPRLRARLEDSLTLVSETTDLVRQVMADLRPPMLDDYGLLPTLRWCGEQLASRQEIDVTLHGREPMPRLPSSKEDALVRITQEALTNVAKHADATEVTIELRERGDRVCLTITDNGAGFDPDSVERGGSTHWGLFTMTERAEAVEGDCRIESQPGEGTTVAVEVVR